MNPAVPQHHEFLIDRLVRIAWVDENSGTKGQGENESTTGVPAAKWLRATLDEVTVLTALEEDWDGYGAEPVSAGAAMSAVKFLIKVAFPKLAAPEVVPVSDGGLQIEWHMNDVDFEVMFEPGAPPKALVEDLAEGTDAEVVAGDEAIKALHRMVDRLSVG